MSATTQTVTNGLPPYLAAAYKEAAERGLQLSREPYEAYQGQRLAPVPQTTNRAIALSQQRVGSFVPYFRQAGVMSERGAEHFPQGYRHRNPYQEGLLNNISRHGQRVFKENTMPKLDAHFIRLGQYGSSKHAKMARNAARDIQADILAKQEDALGNNYLQAIQGFNLGHSNDLRGAQLMSELGITQHAAQLQDVQQLREAGKKTQGQAQALIDHAYEQWKERKRHPHERLAEYMNMLQGVPDTPSTYRRKEVARPSDIYHGSDWRNILQGMGMEALGGWGREFLGGMMARGGSVQPVIAPYMVGI